MREILFRGKANWADGKVKKGDWLYSMTISRHCYNDEEITSYYIGSGNKTIDGKTLGQFTGLTDKNGKKIFEGDILKGYWETILTIFFDEISSSYRVKTSTGQEREPSYYGIDKWEVIGNIHDNPELLGGGEE